jgi:hypothetical protein
MISCQLRRGGNCRTMRSNKTTDQTHRYGVPPKSKLVAQSELVDTRGFIYVTHKNQGLWILKYIGK